ERPAAGLERVALMDSGLLVELRLVGAGSGSAGPAPGKTQRERAAVQGGIAAQQLVPPAPGLPQAVGAQGAPDALLAPARQVDGERHPPQATVPPEMMIGVRRVEVLFARHGVFSFRRRHPEARLPWAAPDTSLSRLRSGPHLPPGGSLALPKGTAPW